MDFAASVFCQATNHERHVQTVPGAGEGGIWRGKFVVTITTADNVLINSNEEIPVCLSVFC